MQRRAQTQNDRIGTRSLPRRWRNDDYRVSNRLLLIGIVGCLLLPRSSDASQRKLLDGVTSCAGCKTPTLQCSGKTIMDDHCAPCATGQIWWPCNIIDECFCKDLAAEQVEEPEETEKELANKCNLPLCEPGETGSKVVPFTDCKEYVSCSGGVPGNVVTCPEGQAYSPVISACNFVAMVTCPSDPTCLPSGEPTASPTLTGRPGTGSPTASARPSLSTSSPTKGEAPPKGAPGGDGDGASAEAKPESTRPDPAVLEGMYVMDAHMAANKIVLTRELLTGPGGRGRGGNKNDFTYLGLRTSLHRMITVGAANQTFYIGQPNVENGRAYGLVNIAAFLAMSVEDSISHGSCDEVNHDLVGGLLPISNACGQDGRNYQEMTCPPGDEKYACEVDLTMRATANGVDAPSGRNGGGGSDEKPKPLYCGPTGDYDGYTGHWDYVSGTESAHPPVENGSGKTDVEGCCWWGRGSIQLRGLCAYGKLNYYLGKRAFDEGRPSMYPDVDFCRDPQAVCSNPNHPDLKWIAGMFRWITEVQTYDQGDFSYMQRLVDFVDGGLRDWAFVHGLSGIVTQGCHEPPCEGGGEFEDGASRKATFMRTLRLLGLSPGNDGGGGRRLGESALSS